MGLLEGFRVSGGFRGRPDRHGTRSRGILQNPSELIPKQDEEARLNRKYDNTDDDGSKETRNANALVFLGSARRALGSCAQPSCTILDELNKIIPVGGRRSRRQVDVLTGLWQLQRHDVSTRQRTRSLIGRCRKRLMVVFQ